MISNLAARAMWTNLPKITPEEERWRNLADRMLYQVTLASAHTDIARDEALRLAAEVLALTKQVNRLQARNSELWDLYIAKGGNE